MLEKNQVLKIIVVLALVNEILLLVQTNRNLKQSAEIQMLKQNNIEQEEEKEMYRQKCEEYERMMEEV